MEVCSPNHWTTKEFPRESFLNWIFPVLLRYNGHISLCKFKGNGVIVWLTCIVKVYNRFSWHPFHRYNKRRKQKRKKKVLWELSGFILFKLVYLLRMKVLITQSCPTLCDPMDCSPLCSSVHEILQASILECVAISYCRGSSQPKNSTRFSCIAGRCYTIWATRDALSWR